jgi:hypothetical protein
MISDIDVDNIKNINFNTSCVKILFNEIGEACNPNKKTVYKYKLIAGNISNEFVSNSLVSWQSFYALHYKNRIFDIRYYNNMLTFLISLVPNAENPGNIRPDTPVANEKVFMYSLYKIYNLPYYNLVKGFSKAINIHKLLDYALKHVFMSWKSYIEHTIISFIELRNTYIHENSGTENDSTNNLHNLITNWNYISDRNAITSSSPILFFNFIKNDIPEIKPLNNNNKQIIKIPDDVYIKIQKIKWFTKNEEINSIVNGFLTKCKINDFTYNGYCKHASINSLRSLLKFPLDELVKCNAIITSKIKTRTRPVVDINYSSMDKLIKKIMVDISNINTFNITLDNNSKSSMTPPPKTLDNRAYNIVIYKEYAEHYIKLYNDILPFLKSQEDKFINIVIDINNFTEILNCYKK